jgi:H+-transporting ATPase
MGARSRVAPPRLRSANRTRNRIAWAALCILVARGAGRPQFATRVSAFTQAAPALEVKAEVKPAAKVASILEAKTEVNPNAKPAPTPDIASKPPIDLTPKLVERIHALYEELGRQEVLAVQGLEQAQKTSKEQTVP